MKHTGAHPEGSTGDFFRNKKLMRSSSEYRRWLNFCLKYEYSKHDIYYQFGYETFGAVLLKFCEWMIKNVNKNKISQIIFFSRDGYIMKKAFEILPESKGYDLKYAYVSRRSLRVPMLWKYEKPSLEAIHPTRYISLQDLFESVGLIARDYASLIKDHGYNLETVIKDEEIEKNKNLLNLLMAIWPSVKANSKKEFTAAKKYISYLDLKDNVAVVDIGWRGSMQHYLDGILKEMGKDIRLKGYYITLSSSMIRGQDMHGYLLDVDDKSEGCDIHRGYVGLLETLFLKTEGSVCNYGEDENGNPILYPYEYEINGQFTREAKTVERIQEGALQFIKDYIKNRENFLDNTDSIFAFANLHKFSTDPSLQDLRMFEDFRFFNGSVSYLAKAKPIYRYIIRPKELIRDFYGARWRIGFMKSLFHIWLPYKKCFDLIMYLVKQPESRLPDTMNQHKA